MGHVEYNNMQCVYMNSSWLCCPGIYAIATMAAATVPAISTVKEVDLPKSCAVLLRIGRIVFFFIECVREPLLRRNVALLDRFHSIVSGLPRVNTESLD